LSSALLALRNLARNPRRTALSLAIVAAGTAAIGMTAGFVRFSFDGLAGALVRGGLGHLEIVPAAAAAGRTAGALDRPVAADWSDWRAVRERVEDLDGVAAVGANLHLLGLAQAADGRSVSFAGVGVEPEREERMGIETKLRRGDNLSTATPAPGEDTALLATGLAESLGVEPGATVTLLSAREDGMLNAVDVRVAGIVTTGIADLDSRWLKVPLATAQRLLETDGVSDLLVGLDEISRTDGAAARLRGELAGSTPPLSVVTWRERAPFYGQVRDLYGAIFRFLGAVVLVLVVLAASNTLLMSVFERIRELGVLRAIGTLPAQIAAMLLAEALWLAALGAALGTVLGAAGIGAVNAAGLTMPPPPGAVDPIDLRLVFVPSAFAGAAALMLAVLALASIVPIVRAARLPIVDALEHV